MSLVEVDERIPQINVSALFKFNTPDEFPKTISVTDQYYLRNLSKILSETPRETVVAYLSWIVIHKYGIYVRSDASKTLAALRNKLSGRDSQATQDRWRSCIRHVDSGDSSRGLGWMLSSLLHLLHLLRQLFCIR